MLDGDLEAAGEEKQGQQEGLMGKAYRRGRTSGGRCHSHGTSTVTSSGEAVKQDPSAYFLLPSCSTSCNKFSQIPWSSLTENGRPHSIQGKYTPFLSQAAVKNVLLSAGDQGAHRGR